MNLTTDRNASDTAFQPIVRRLVVVPRPKRHKRDGVIVRTPCDLLPSPALRNWTFAQTAPPETLTRLFAGASTLYTIQTNSRALSFAAPPNIRQQFVIVGFGTRAKY